MGDFSSLTLFPYRSIPYQVHDEIRPSDHRSIHTGTGFRTHLANFGSCCSHITYNFEKLNSTLHWCSFLFYQLCKNGISNWIWGRLPHVLPQHVDVDISSTV